MTDELDSIVADIKHELEAEEESKHSREIVDWAGLREQTQIPWTELMEDVTEPFPVLLKQILRKCCLIPKADKQIPLILTMLSYWSPACEEFFVCWLQSHQPGSGKSDLAFIASRLYPGCNLTASSITPAGFKRLANIALFHDPQLGFKAANNEKAAIMLLEDLDDNGLARNEGLLFNGLKVGAKRSTAILTMASGSNSHDVITFYVGCPKWVTTIHKLWQLPKYRELQRRSLIIELKNFAHWTEDDESEFYAGADIDDLISPYDVDWTGFSEAFFDYWKAEETREKFIYWKKLVKGFKKHGISREKWGISHDFVTIGLTCGYWESLPDAVLAMRDYWESQGDDTESSKSGFVQLLEQYVNNYRTRLDPYPRVKPKTLSDKVREWYKESMLDVNPTDRNLREAMLELGYTLQRVGNTDKTEWRHLDDR